MNINLEKNKMVQWLSDLTVGGEWGRTLQANFQKNLRLLWFDGLFSSASDNIILSFISLYILSLGASEVQIGLMSSLSSLTAAIFLLIGAILAERLGHPKEISVVSGGLFGRLAILLLVLVPFFFHGQFLIWAAISFSVMRDACANLGFPSWMSVVNEVVPIDGRGRYFGSRNFVMSIAGMITTVLAGKLITLFITPYGYQIAFGAAFLLGLFSTNSFAHLNIQAAHTKPNKFTLLRLTGIGGMLKGHRQFFALIMTAAMWNFSINIAGPFFNVFMVKELRLSASTVGLLAVVSALSGLLVLNWIGTLSDRLGPRKMQLISMSLIPFLPLAWVFVTRAWHIAIINIFVGILWGAFNLSSFNLLLNSIPKNQVSRYSALYQIVVTLSLSAGALVGSLIITHWGFVAIFVASALARVFSTGFFAKFVHEPQKQSEMTNIV
jgi:MFS family permease